MLDAVYMPEPLENKPEWFNGFVHLETHPKEKYGWNRYVYLPNYYSDDIEYNNISSITPDIVASARFGIAVPKENNIGVFHADSFDRTEARHYSENSKEEIGVKSLGAITVFNVGTGENETHRYLFANDSYIIRQLHSSDRPDFLSVIRAAGERIGAPMRLNLFSDMANSGMMIAPFTMNGEIHGGQAFSIHEDHIAGEPLTYIDEKARGQGIFSIYHEMSIDLGNAVGSEYIYVRCEADSKMRKVYESYNYIKQRSKWVRSSDPVELYILHYKLQTTQQALF